MDAKRFVRKVVSGLSVASLVAGLTLAGGCATDKSSCGNGSCDGQVNEKSSCSAGGEKSSCSGGTKEHSSCSAGSPEKSSCSG